MNQSETSLRARARKSVPSSHAPGTSITTKHFDTETFLCCPVKPSSRLAPVFIQDRLQRLHLLSRKNFVLSILCLVVVASNIVTFILNFLAMTPLDVVQNDGDPAAEADASAETGVILFWGAEAKKMERETIMDKVGLERPFHLFEFWMSFLFAVLEVFIIVYSPRSVSDIYSRPTVLKGIIFVNIVFAFVPPMLISFSLELYETLSHEIEYTNGLLVSFLDVVLALRLHAARERSSVGSTPPSSTPSLNDSYSLFPEEQLPYFSAKAAEDETLRGFGGVEAAYDPKQVSIPDTSRSSRRTNTVVFASTTSSLDSPLLQQPSEADVLPGFTANAAAAPKQLQRISPQQPADPPFVSGQEQCVATNISDPKRRPRFPSVGGFGSRTEQSSRSRAVADGKKDEENGFGGCPCCQSAELLPVRSSSAGSKPVVESTGNIVEFPETPRGGRWGNVRSPHTRSVAEIWAFVWVWSQILVPPIMAISQLVFYNADFLLFAFGLQIGPDPMSHIFEFLFNILSAGISFLFCIDNKFICDQKQTELIGQWCGGDL